MRKFWTGVVAASFMTVGLAAQQNPPGGGAPGAPGAPGGQRPVPAPSAQAGKAVTLSGCIQNAPPAAAGAASDAKFVLADAKMAGPAGAPGAPVGTAGTATRYTLSGEEKAISPHLNHQVEITGTVESSGSGDPGGKPAAPTLKVESVKMVAAKCS